MNLLLIKKKLESHFDYQFVINKDLSMGLLSTNQAFINAKIQKKNPQDIAIDLKNEIQSYLDTIEENIFFVENLGPYVNISIKFEGFVGIDYSIEKNSSINYFLDYVSPNVAKELHLGHMRNMNIGDSIRRLLKEGYTNVITDNHWGDWGVQFGILIWAYKYFIDNNNESTVIINEESQIINKEIYKSNPLQALIRMYVWATQNKDKFDDYDSIVRQEFLKLEQGDEYNTKLWKDFINTSVKEVSNDMQLFNIPKHDIEQGESYYEKYNEELYNYFESNNLWEKADKARFIDFEKLGFKNLGYGYLISSTGYTTYLFRDIASRINWIEEHKADKMISVTGNEQLHHFKQLNTICNYLSTLPTSSTICKNYQKLNSDNIIHIPYGFLTLKGGKKMSTRKGIIYNARNLYNEVNNLIIDNLKSRNSDNIENKSHKMTLSAIKWADLSRDSIHNIEFDINEITSFEGNTGIYQLYTYARIQSILDKNLAIVKTNNISTLNPQEQYIYNLLITTPIIINDAIIKLKPHLICNHLFDICNQINSWYNTTSVTNEVDAIRKSTLINLLQQVSNQLTHLNDLIGIELIESI
jgi:arginyl-tRNA synthetase